MYSQEAMRKQLGIEKQATEETHELIKQYLKDNGISQVWLCREIGISAPKLNMALSGVRSLSLDEYALICGVLGVNTDYFLKPRLLDKTKNC